MADLQYLDASRWINAYEAGDQQRQATEKRVVNQRAGGLLATGDYNGAAGAMYGAGELQTGSAIANMGRQHEVDLANIDEKKREGLRESFKAAYQMFKPVETEEQLAALKANPQAVALVPDLAQADLTTVRQIVATGAQLFPEENVVVGGRLVGKQTGQVRYEAPEQPKWVERTKADGSTEWFDINVEGGTAQAPAGSPAPAAPAAGDWVADVAAAAPDAQVTSGYRSPADNRRVGGVANSRHLTGEAVDLVPRPGETMGQLAARVRSVQGVRTVPEGDHVHVQRQGSAPQGRGIVRGSAPKPKETDQWVDLPGGGQQNLRTGKKDGVPGTDKAPTEAQNKAVSFSYRTQQANRRMTELVDRGIVKPRTPTAQLFDNRDGVMRVVTKTNEDRQFMQAAKEWLAPVLRKDTGAAVTDSELAVYMDIYIPRYEDDAQTIRQKAAARKDAMIALVGETGGLYEKQYGAPKFDVSFVTPKNAGAAKNRPPLSQIFGR